MAFTASAVWDLQVSGSDSNGGGFDAGVAGFPTDGAATLATSTAPVFTSASYTFVAGDVGAWIFVKSGVNWTPGYYRIASVAAGAATLSAAIGAATLATAELSIAAGCATTASPTAATWGIDYSKGTSARISFTDMVIGGTTTQFTSAGNPVGKNFVGNTINVTSGTGFTVQRVAVVSTSGTTATCDKSLGAGASTGGNGALGGALATVSKAISLRVAGNVIWVGPGTYTLNTTITVSAASFALWGWNSARGDRTTTRPVISSTALSGTALLMQITATISFRGLAFSRSGTSGICLQVNSAGPVLRLENCTFTGTYSSGITGTTSGSAFISNCSFASLSGAAISGVGILLIEDCYFDSNEAIHSCADVDVANCIFANIATTVIWSLTIGFIKNCSFYNCADGTYGNIYSASSSGLNEILVENCVMWGTGSSWAEKATTSGNIVSRNNAIGNYGTSYFQVTAGAGDVALSANPFTNAASGDFSLNSTSGGGAACKAIGFPSAFIGTASTSGFQDLGAVQSAVAVTPPSNYGWIG